jgi:hypothetical protein
LNGKRYRLSAGILIACAGQRLAANDGANAAEIRKSFGEFMQIVFTYCGSLSLESLSLERQLVPGGGQEKMEIGDVWNIPFTPARCVPGPGEKALAK